ncbi:hypothetical protein Klosneuvirus_3_262 [Klosneuvirus KNV1]|uniref:C2H2-type domain-containing protein n=1 Tax=Klosneuvirus KNV1 TaxID=1977640 RepID=A0A1V0SK80_9VIRU|nr:hypothetical protein Klosneuvirus_3_262 [Klosneuvirus KNV1]
MKYNCETCNYETNDKSNFNKHLNSQAHSKRKTSIHKVDIKVNKNVNKNIEKLPSKFQCPNCDKNYSSAPSLSRHKKNYCYGDTIKTKLEQEFNEKIKQKELEIKLEYNQKLLEKAEIENKKIQEKADAEIKELKQYIKNTKPTTYNISVKKMIQQTYPDAPHLAMLKNYAIIHKNEDIDFAQDLIYYYKKNKLNSYLGDIIIKYYKKEDPKDQSLWSTDSSRLKYIIKELLASKQTIWSEDDKGLKINKYIIKPLLKYIHEYINEQIEELHDVLENTRGKDCEQIALKQIDLAHIREQIQNGQLKDAINKYIAPSFRFNSDKLISIS